MGGARGLTPSPCPTPPSPLNYETWADSHCEWYIKRGHLKTTLDLYTQQDGDETRAAQGQFLAELGVKAIQ